MRKSAAKKNKRSVVTPAQLVEGIEKARGLLDDDTAAKMVEGFQEAGVLARGMNNVFTLTFQTLVADGRLRNHAANREVFAKAQLLAASILQEAVALGIQEGERRANV